MKRFLLIVALLGGCSKDHTVTTRPGMADHAPTLKVLNVLADGQSNICLRINGNTEGLTTYFVESMRAKGYDVHVTLVAHPGSSQADWAVGGAYYTELITQARLVGHYDVWLHWQGEAEGATMTDPQGQPQPMALASSWGYTFTQYVGAVREALGQPDLPVIFCQIGQDPGFPNSLIDSWEEVQRQQAMIYLPHVYMVKTQDIANFFGWFHTDEAGYRAIAMRIRDVYLNGL